MHDSKLHELHEWDIEDVELDYIPNLELIDLVSELTEDEQARARELAQALLQDEW